MQTKASFLVVLALTVVFAGVAAAQQEPPPGYQQPPPGYQQQPPPGYAPPQPMESAPTTVLFGAPGQLVISDDLLISAINTKYSPPDSTVGGASSSETFIQFQPAVDIFVARNLSIGGQVSISLYSEDQTDTSTTRVGVLPRIGYNIPLGSKASIWPRLAAGYYFRTDSAGGGYPSTSGYTFTFKAFVPVLFHPVPHFFIGGGPIFSTDLVSQYDDVDSFTTSEYGVQTTVGGYFGGR